MLSVLSYNCKSCTFVGKNRKHLACHVALNHSSKVYRCTLCPFVTRHQANFYRHRRSIHRLNSANVCEVCGRLCDSQDDLVSHTSSEHPELLDGLLRRLEAKKARYARQASLIAHSGEGGYSADGGSRIQDLMHDYAQPIPTHSNAQQDDEEEEEEEEEMDNGPSSAKRPLGEDASPYPSKKSRTGRRTYNCAQCGLVTKWPREFLTHRKDVHGDRITIHDCPFCEYASKQPQKLQRHCNIVHKEEMQRGETTLRLENSVIRKTVVAGAARDTFYRCGQCSFQAKSRFLVAEHERTSHLKKRFFRCQQCGYVSNDRTRYARHLKHHTLPKVKCPYCDFRSAYKWNMDRHMKYHTNEGDFQCDRCVYKTMSRQSLTAHCLHHHHENLKELSDSEAGSAEVVENDADDNRLMIDERPRAELQKSNPPLKLTLRRSGGVMESKPIAIESKPSTSAISMIKCQYCPQKMMWPSEMKKHEATHFKMTKKHGCPMCDVRFDHLEHLESHVMQEHCEEEAPKQTGAAKGTRAEGSPVRTTSTPIIIELGKSDDARRASSSGRTLDIPIKSKQALHRCTTCGYTTRWISELKKHELVHGTVKPFSCKYCSYSSRWKGDITRHVFRMHKEHVGEEEEEDPKSSHVLRFLLSQPQESGQQQASPASLAVKKLTPSPSQKRPAQSSPAYEQGIEYVPKAPSGQLPRIVKKYKCPQCSFLTRTASRFHVHMIQHLNKRPFMCSICHYRSNWQWDVNKHIKSKSNNDADHKSAELLVMDETGFKNYAKYQIYLVDVEESPKGDRILEPAETAKNNVQEAQRVAAAASAGDETENIVVTPDIVYPDQEDQGACTVTEVPAPVQVPFSCGHCSFSSIDRRTVVNHLGTHAGNRPYKCRICDFVSKWYHLVLMHVRHRHNGSVRDVESRVSYVERGTVLRLGESEPEKQHTVAADGDGRNYHCNLCPYRCVKLCHMEFHMKQHTPKEGAIFKCDYCPYYVKFKKTLSRHQVLHRQRGDIPLEKERTPFMPPTAMSGSDARHKSPIPQRYTVTGQPMKRHACEQCPYTSDNKTQYLYHKQFHRPNKHAPFKCGHCSYWSTHSHLMSQHQKIHKLSDPVRVPPQEASSSAIQTTTAIVNGAARKMFKCRYCPMMNKRRANVKVHERMHMGLKTARFQCVLCSYKCNNTGVLASHMKLHKAENPDLDMARMRTFCDNLNALARPVPGSAGTAPVVQPRPSPEKEKGKTPPQRKKIFSYFCDKCPAMFKSHTDLDTHRTYHSSAHLYPCHLCDYRARHKPHLHKHLLVHTPEYAERQNGYTLAEIRSHDRQQSVEPEDPVPSGAADQMLLLEEAETRAFVDASNGNGGPPQNTPTKLHRCNRCPASFQKAITLDYHASLHGSAGVYACHFCNYAANSAANVNAHSQLHYRGALKQRQPPKLFRCNKCPASFSKQNRYESHLTLHGRNERFRCAHCDYSVKFAANLVKHRKLHEGVPPEPVALSSVASSSPSSSPAIITVSSQSSTPDRSEKTPPISSGIVVSEEKIVYGCSRCPYTYHRRETVQNHLRHHGAMDGICCAHCDFYAGSVSMMRDHGRLHFQLTRRIKPQAFMKCDKVEVLYADGSEKKALLFGDAGEGSEGGRFFPDNAIEDDQENEEITSLVTVKEEVDEECTEMRDDESTIVDVTSLEDERQCELIEEDLECDEITAASRQALEDLLTNVVNLSEQRDEDGAVGEAEEGEVTVVPEPEEDGDMETSEQHVESTTKPEGSEESAQDLLNRICNQNGMHYDEEHTPTEEDIAEEVECETFEEGAVADEDDDGFIIVDGLPSSHGTSLQTLVDEEKSVNHSTNGDAGSLVSLEPCEEKTSKDDEVLETGNPEKPMLAVEEMGCSEAEVTADTVKIEETNIDNYAEEETVEKVEDKGTCEANETNGDVTVPEDVFKMQSPSKDAQAVALEKAEGVMEDTQTCNGEPANWPDQIDNDTDAMDAMHEGGEEHKEEVIISEGDVHPEENFMSSDETKEVLALDISVLQEDVSVEDVTSPTEVPC